MNASFSSVAATPKARVGWVGRIVCAVGVLLLSIDAAIKLAPIQVVSHFGLPQPKGPVVALIEMLCIALCLAPLVLRDARLSSSAARSRAYAMRRDWDAYRVSAGCR
jgi:hypothetical protein